MDSALVLLAAAVMLSSAPAPAGRTTAAVRHRHAHHPRDGPRGWVRAHRWWQQLALRRPPLPALALAADIDLFIASLHAGLSVDGAVLATASAAHTETAHHWHRVARFLAAGATSHRAWAEVAHIPGFDDIAYLVRISGHSGAAIASGCQRIAQSLRDDAAAAATATAERAGVLISLPLALCFLPAFIVLGLAPVVISLAGQLR